VCSCSLPPHEQTVEDVAAATGARFRIADGYNSRWLMPMLQEPGDLAAMQSPPPKPASAAFGVRYAPPVDPSTVQWQAKKFAPPRNVGPANESAETAPPQPASPQETQTNAQPPKARPSDKTAP
jgi:hypothetical protein